MVDSVLIDALDPLTMAYADHVRPTHTLLDVEREKDRVIMPSCSSTPCRGLDGP